MRFDLLHAWNVQALAEFANPLVQIRILLDKFLERLAGRLGCSFDRSSGIFGVRFQTSKERICGLARLHGRFLGRGRRQVQIQASA